MWLDINAVFYQISILSPLFLSNQTTYPTQIPTYT